MFCVEVSCVTRIVRILAIQRFRFLSSLDRHPGYHIGRLGLSRIEHFLVFVDIDQKHDHTTLGHGKLKHEML